jgi:ATP-dependent DNA helicase RecG
MSCSMASSEQLDFNFDGPLALLTVDEIYERASVELFRALREDRRVERKPAGIHTEALSDYFCMWANTAPEGGILVIGMDDDPEGTVSGCSGLSIHQLNRLESTRVEYCADSRSESKRVEAINSVGAVDYLLVVRVFYRTDKVVRTNSGNAFWRIADKKKRLSEEEIRELQIDEGEVDFELEPCGIDYPSGFNEELIRTYVDRFAKMRGLAPHTDEEVLLIGHLGKRQGSVFIPNMACALLFAHDPRVKFPGCFVRFLRFDGETEGTGEKFNAVKDIHIEGSIPYVIVETAKVLENQLREFSRLGKDGKFYTAPEYPPPAWYEALVNACVHRSYSLRTMNVFVKMFDNRLEVESPGGFPPLVTPKNIYDVHKPRNPYLMEALLYLDFVKCAHEGTRRMRDTMSAESLPEPEFRQVESPTTPLVRVVLRNDVRQRRVWVDSDVTAIVGEAIMKDLTEDEKRAINFAAEYGAISVSDVQRLTQRSWPSAKRLLVNLVVKNILEHRARHHLDRDPQARFRIRAQTAADKLRTMLRRKRDEARARHAEPPMLAELPLTSRTGADDKAGEEEKKKQN